MQIIFEYHDINTSTSLESFITKKLNNLEEKYSFVHRADVFFKKENTSSDETGLICNIRLSLPGPRLFAEATNDDFHNSVSEAINILERQLKKRKEKMSNH
tara:strand:- start:50756 stop:51058 length:303 start_codon:yes stop_codon:yes gene_type:complete